MLNHKKIVNKFYKLESKYYNNENYEISKNQLHLLIWNKNFIFPKFTFLGIISNLILMFLSCLSILVCKIKKIKIANYFIVHKNKNGLYDFRSNYVLNNLNLNKSLNIIRCSSFLDSLKAYILYPNVIFYLPIDYLNSSLFFKKSTLRNNYKILHKKENKNYKQLKKIFIFLQIKKFVSIDDQRVIQIFLKICSDLNIKSFGYMHYKFSKFVIGIKYRCFDNFLVWSEYFKKKLIEVNSKYEKKNLFISGYFKKKYKLKNDKNKINILYIIDLDLDFKSTTRLLVKLNKEKKINLYLKLKPQKIETKWESFCIKENIKYFKFENMDEVNSLVRMDYFLANISTALLEASLYGAIPLKLSTKNDFADDLIQDKVVKKISNYCDIIRVAKKKPSSKEISKIFYKVWGKKKYKTAIIKKILLDIIYDRKD